MVSLICGRKQAKQNKNRFTETEMKGWLSEGREWSISEKGKENILYHIWMSLYEDR